MSEQEPSAEHSNHDSVEDQTPKDSPLSPAPSNGDQSDHQQVPLESADSVENSGTIQPLGRAENSGKDDQGNLNPSRMESVVQGDSSLADETSVVPSEENVAARTDHQPFLFIDSPIDDAEDESEKQTAEPLPKEETIPANEPAPLTVSRMG